MAVFQSLVCECHCYIKVVRFRCEADSGALAKYVVALVKKDRPVSELKDTCVDQLLVFLQTSEYHKIPKYSDTRKIAVIILKFEQCGTTIE